jgi:hypothetical protein
MTQQATPTVGDWTVPDLSALFGGVVWLVALVVGPLGIIDRALALAPLVLVPLGIGMAGRAHFGGLAGQCYRAAVWLQPVGAVLFTASLVVGNGIVSAALAAPWLAVTGLLGLAALARTIDRGGVALPETAVDFGLAYASVGAVALLLYHLDITFWFTPTIILLTAVHFHYAGFTLPVITGLTGRSRQTPPSTALTALVGVILAGPAIIAVGISFSPTVEVVAVGGFTVAVALFGGHVLLRVAPTRPRTQGLLLGASAVALPVSMAMALGYGVSTFTGVDLGLDISTMVRLHGSLNAFGFALLGLVGWRLAVPEGTQ